MIVEMLPIVRDDGTIEHVHATPEFHTPAKLVQKTRDGMRDDVNWALRVMNAMMERWTSALYAQSYESYAAREPRSATMQATLDGLSETQDMIEKVSR